MLPVNSLIADEEPTAGQVVKGAVVGEVAGQATKKVLIKASAKAAARCVGPIGAVMTAVDVANYVDSKAPLGSNRNPDTLEVGADGIAERFWEVRWEYGSKYTYPEFQSMIVGCDGVKAMP